MLDRVSCKGETDCQQTFSVWLELGITMCYAGLKCSHSRHDSYIAGYQQNTCIVQCISVLHPSPDCRVRCLLCAKQIRIRMLISHMYENLFMEYFNELCVVPKVLENFVRNKICELFYYYCFCCSLHHLFTSSTKGIFRAHTEQKTRTTFTTMKQAYTENVQYVQNMIMDAKGFKRKRAHIMMRLRVIYLLSIARARTLLHIHLQLVYSTAPHPLYSQFVEPIQ